METIERILIGSAISQGGSAVMICKRVNLDMLSDTGKIIFTGIKKLIERKSQVNLSNICAATGIERDVFKELIIDAAGTPDIEFMIERFIENYRMKVEDQIAFEIQIACKDNKPDDVAALHAKREKIIAETFQGEVDPMTEYEAWNKALVKRVDDRSSGRAILPGISTGFYDIDLATGGSLPGELIVVGASPGIGKTSFALHLAMTALNKGNAVGFISVEMSFRALFTRVVAYETGINSRDIRDGYLATGQLESIGKASDKILNSRIKIINNLYNIDAITATIRDLTSRLGINFWVVDYLQLITSPAKDKRIQIGDICRDLTLVAKSLEVPVVLLSQLARSDQKPKMRDLKESGDIEAHAHKIILLSIEDEMIQVDLVKNRDGETGTFMKSTNRATGRWFDPNEPTVEPNRPDTNDTIPF